MTEEPKWFSRAQTERLYGKLIEQTGGSPGMRDSGLLESALARPRNLYAYGERDVFQLAASYAESLSRNHAFIDGNKRIAFATAGLFLGQNGHRLLSRQDDGHVHMMEQLAQGKLTREQAARHFQENSEIIEREKSQVGSLSEREQRAAERDRATARVKSLRDRLKDRDHDRER